MQKIILLLLLSCLGGLSGQAQMAQVLETMSQQIAALQGYIATAEKGYKIAEEGLHTIGDIKNGEFNLHSVFFQSLKTVSPSVKNAVEVAEVFILQVSTVRQFSAALQFCRQSGRLTSDEIGYIGKVYAALVSEGEKDMDALSTLLTDGQLEMDDGERLQCIQAIDTDMQEQYEFMKRFTGQAGLLVEQRIRGQTDNATLRQLYGLE